MSTFYKDTTMTIHNGNVIDILPTIEDETIQCCVTSPPYWGLRDYGTGKWEGGSPGCSHVRSEKSKSSYTGQNKVAGGNGDGIYKSVCKKCGAIRIDKQIGLEDTLQEYIEKMTMVFREVKRVLKPDGTLWLNLGDTYAGSGMAGNNEKYMEKHTMFGKNGYAKGVFGLPQKVPQDLKPKDLCGIPWRIAFALQADGWYLRSDIIWSKPNPMPESVYDRPTKSHEYIFLLSKSKKYYYDYEAIKERCTGTSHARGNGVNPNARVPTGWDTGNGGHAKKVGRYKSKQNESFSSSVKNIVTRRNKRSVWTIQPFAYPDAHFATFPPDLIKPCIIAGCPAGGTVIDPFAGSGTTMYVSKELNRKSVGIELNEDYCKLILSRTAQETLKI